LNLQNLFVKSQRILEKQKIEKYFGKKRENFPCFGPIPAQPSSSPFPTEAHQRSSPTPPRRLPPFDKLLGGELAAVDACKEMAAAA
jgi:hypothetical protein